MRRPTTRTVRHLASLAALTGVAMLLPAAIADADVLIFTCGTGYANLCQSAPDGASRSQLTQDATGQGNDVYASPSLSRDGTKLAFLRRGQLYALSAATGKTTGPAGTPGQFLVTRIRPDGGKIAVGEFGDGALNAICTYAVDLSGRDCIGSGGSLGWDGTAGVFTSGTDARNDYRESVCLLLDDPTVPSGCARYAASAANEDLYDAVASPDGSLIAVTSADEGAVRGSIALYDSATGALVRTLTGGPHDGGPTWSPDGRAIAFDRSGAGVMTVSATAAAPGTEQLVDAGGREPTWGGGTIAATSTGRAGCTVPKLVGKRLAAARTALRRAGCGTPTIHGSKRTRAKVTHTSPAAGKRLAAGRHVVLTTRG